MYPRKHSADFLFLLIIFGFFAVLAFSTVVLGAGFYRSAVSNSQKLASVDMAAGYIAEKLRQTDETDSFSVEEFGDSQALALRSQYNDETFITWIYTWDDTLRELFVREDADINPEMGTALADISRLFVTPVSDSLYKLQAENSDGDRTELYISPRALY